MSLYNMLFGVNECAPVLLKILGFSHNDIPRFRNCFLHDNAIVIHTRTGGGNRDFYEEEGCAKENYGSDYEGPFNSDLRQHPNFITDSDDDFDSTYANFFYSYPQEYAEDLKALRESNEAHMPSEQWKSLFEQLDKEKNKA